MSNKQIVVLNSGGYDSICLINYLLENCYGSDDILSVFFNYGQRNMEYERECARKICVENNIEHLEVDLPKFNWTKSSLTNKEGDNQYVEMRNLIFISYGTSIAQSFGANAVSLALLFDGLYVDSNAGFIDLLSEVTELVGIEIWCPFIECSKDQIQGLLNNQINPEDFYSCNTPLDNGEPCGVCPDCLILEKIFR